VLSPIPDLERTKTLPEARLQDMQRWFEEFTAGFPKDDPELAFGFSLKVEHTMRMLPLMADLAHAEGLDVNLACACALLHDVGRFPQLLRYRTFADAVSMNHARASCDLLEEHQVLKGLEAPIAQIIHFAILHHNAKVIPEGLDPQILPYARVLRDADKLDILFVHVSGYESRIPLGELLGYHLPDSGRVSPVVLECVASNRLVSRSDLASLDDAKLMLLGWLHDLNTPRAFQVFQERRYLERLYSTMPQDEALSNLHQQLSSLIQERSCLR